MVLKEQDGISGWNNSECIINSCINNGEIKGDGKYTGGISGQTCELGKIEYCINNGNITGQDEFTGGITGTANESVKIEKCYNIGKINGYNYVGGIMGDFYKDVIIRNCFNKGNIIGNNCVGGIVGFSSPTYEGSIINCYNSGTIEGTNNAGQLMGDITVTRATITNCYYYDGSNIVYQGDTALEAGVTYTTQTFIDNANSGLSEEEKIWKIDSNENNGMPDLIF